MNSKLTSSTQALQQSDQKQNAWGQTWKQKQETPKLLCDLCGFTTTQHNNQHKTYRPPSTKHQPSPTTTNTTTTHHCHQHQHTTPTHHTNPAHPAHPSLAPARPASRPPARLRPSGGILGNIASQPAATSYQLPATSRQPTASQRPAASQASQASRLPVAGSR